jgi:hypothetical protein
MTLPGFRFALHEPPLSAIIGDPPSGLPMTARPYILSEVMWKTVRQTTYDVAVLPWGATEAHNLHLPYVTDNVEAERIAAVAARLAWDRGARAVVLPVVPFGVKGVPRGAGGGRLQGPL